MHAPLIAANSPDLGTDAPAGNVVTLPYARPRPCGVTPHRDSAPACSDPDVEYLFRLRRAVRDLERLGYHARAAATRRAIDRLVSAMFSGVAS